MEYLIQYDKNRYLTTKFTTTDDIGKAARFSSLRTANNFISNNMPKELFELKHKFKAVRVEVVKPGEYKVIEPVSEQRKTKFEDCYINNNESIKTLKDDIAKLDLDLDTFVKSKANLISRLSEIDKRISKIYHFIELNDIEPDIAIEIVLLLKETLIKKRQIKHCLQLIASVETDKPKSIQDLLYTINNLVKNLY